MEFSISNCWLGDYIWSLFYPKYGQNQMLQLGREKRLMEFSIKNSVFGDYIWSLGNELWSQK